MGEQEHKDDPNVAALRAAGHHDAADLLVQVAWERSRSEAVQAMPDPAPATIRLLDSEPGVRCSDGDAIGALVDHCQRQQRRARDEY